MTIYNIEFSDESVFSDRNALAECYRSEDLPRVQQQAKYHLRQVFLCPWVGAAISILSACLHDELQEHKAMAGSAIHDLIDPVLKDSPHADGLREKLNG